MRCLSITWRLQIAITNLRWTQQQQSGRQKSESIVAIRCHSNNRDVQTTATIGKAIDSSSSRQPKKEKLGSFGQIG